MNMGIDYIIIHGGGWFVTCIMIYYIVLYFIQRFFDRQIMDGFWDSEFNMCNMVYFVRQA